MKTHRLTTLGLVAAVTVLLGADKPAKDIVKYAPDGTRIDAFAKPDANDRNGWKRIEDSRTIDEFVDQLAKARSASNRMEAAGTLHRIASGAVDSNQRIPEHATIVAGLVKGLQDRDENVRREVMFALMVCGTKDSVPHIAKNLKTDTDENRTIAARTLGKMKHADAVKYLEQSANNVKESDGVRDASIRSLGMIGGKDAKASLEKLAKNAPKSLVDAIDEALGATEGLSRE